MTFSVIYQSVVGLFISEKLFAFWKKNYVLLHILYILWSVFQINNKYNVYRTLLSKYLPSDRSIKFKVYVLSFTNKVVILVAWFSPPHIVFSRDNNTVSIGWRVIISRVPSVEIKVGSVVPVNILYSKPKRIYQGRLTRQIKSKAYYSPA